MNRRSRKLSRINRRTRLRSTALRIVRSATDMPSRALPVALGCALSVKNSLPNRRPLA